MSLGSACISTAAIRHPGGVATTKLAKLATMAKRMVEVYIMSVVFDVLITVLDGRVSFKLQLSERVCECVYSSWWWFEMSVVLKSVGRMILQRVTENRERVW